MKGVKIGCQRVDLWKIGNDTIEETIWKPTFQNNNNNNRNVNGCTMSISLENIFKNHFMGK